METKKTRKREAHPIPLGTSRVGGEKISLGFQFSPVHKPGCGRILVEKAEIIRSSFGTPGTPLPFQPLLS